MKGKSTRSRPRVIKEDIVEIPPEILEQHTNLMLSMDIMYVNGEPNLTAIDRSIRFRSLVTMNNRTAPELFECLDQILRLYNGAGFLIKTISCDGEFKSLMDQVKDDLNVQ